MRIKPIASALLLLVLPLGIWVISYLNMLYNYALSPILGVQANWETLLQPWRLIGYAGIHASGYHLLVNTALLCLIGWVWPKQEVQRYYRLFLCSVVICAVVFVLVRHNSEGWLYGASGGIASLLAFMLTSRFYPPKQSQSTCTKMVWWLLLCVVVADQLPFFSAKYSTGIAYIHGLGYLVGMLDCVTFPLKSPRSYTQKKMEVITKVRTSGYEALTVAEKEWIRKDSQIPQ